MDEVSYKDVKQGPTWKFSSTADGLKIIVILSDATDYPNIESTQDVTLPIREFKLLLERLDDFKS